MITLDRASIALNLSVFKYMLLNFSTLANQLTRYKLAEADVTAYVQSAVEATVFFPPTESACPLVQYDVLFEGIDKYL